MADAPLDPPPPPTVVSGPPSGNSGTFIAGQTLGGRYTILGLLGRGGMGAVYKAWDEQLGVPVAIKTIAFDETTEAGKRADLERRFKREAQLARQITHRNVVRIHDVGEIDGVKYLTMALIEGETLASIIHRLGPMPIRDTMHIARQVVDGLAAAHDVGVVHRDLKPENIMVTGGGHALIMDFGIALSSTTATNSGVIAGTLEYMAPEQMRSGGVDGRADVYAFGLILYDMLTGRHRLDGFDLPMAELMTRANTAPAPIRTVRPEIPEPLEGLIARATQPRADDRFADSAQLKEALSRLALDGHVRKGEADAADRWKRWLWPGVAVTAILLVLGLAAVWTPRSPEPPPPSPNPISVIVADFENRTGNAVFDGLVEQALMVGVEGASFISTYPRRDALRLAAQFPDKTLSVNTAKLIALREGLAAVVTGAIEPAPKGFRLPVQVLQPGPQERLLFEAVVEASGQDDLFSAVGRLAVRVRGGLGDITTSPDQVNTAETFTANSLEAAAEYVRGQNLAAEGRANEALDAYRKALAIDPELARAWSGMGAIADNQRRRDEATKYYANALSMIERMTERERFRTRGAYYATMGNADAARDENELLIKRFPSDSTGLNNLALAYFNMFDFARALDLGRKAAAIYPGNVLRQSNVALYALYASDFAAAVPQAERVLSLNKDYPRGHLVLALAHLANGEFDRAAERYRTLAALPAIAREFSAHGLADIARYRGRPAEAAGHLAAALAAETAAAPRARLTIALASTRLAQGRTGEAIKLAASLDLAALDPATLTAAAETFVAAGRLREAGAVVDQLTRRIGPAPTAFATVIRSQIALAQGNAAEARRLLAETRERADAWLVRFWLGRAYLALGLFAEADSEFDACLRRRGEAAAVFMDDFPTYHRLLDVHYYQGLAREGLKSAGAIESFKTFLAPKEGGDETGGPVADARKRVAGR